MILVLFFVWLITLTTVVPIVVANYKYRCRELEFDKEKYRDKQAEILYKRYELGD